MAFALAGGAEGAFAEALIQAAKQEIADSSKAGVLRCVGRRVPWCGPNLGALPV